MVTGTTQKYISSAETIPRISHHPERVFRKPCHHGLEPCPPPKGIRPSFGPSAAPWAVHLGGRWRKSLSKHRAFSCSRALLSRIHQCRGYPSLQSSLLFWVQNAIVVDQKVWTNRILRFLDARLDQPKNVMVQSETHDSALLIHPWPNSMFYSAGVTMCPDEASKSRRDSPKGQR